MNCLHPNKEEDVQEPLIGSTHTLVRLARMHCLDCHAIWATPEQSSANRSSVKRLVRSVVLPPNWPAWGPERAAEWRE